MKRHQPAKLEGHWKRHGQSSAIGYLKICAFLLKVDGLGVCENPMEPHCIANIFVNVA